MGKRCFSRIRCSRLFRQFLLADDFARRLNFSGLEASGSARVAIELRIDSRGSSELLAINRQAETDGESSGSETCGARRALDSLGRERPKRAALPESRESETCEAPGRVSAAAVESGVHRTDERF